jgi:hypothetical protein
MSNDKSTGTHFNSLKVDSIDTNTNEHQSLFEEKGFIDLAKGKNDIDWKDYKLNKDGKTFELNNNDEPVNFKNFQKIDTNTKNNRSLTIDDLVKFTSNPKNPQMKLEYQDFAYCSRLGFYPNNRLVVLRRFAGPIGDNLYQKPPNHKDTDDIILRPISTMVTWQKQEEALPDITFGLKHTDYSQGFVSTLKSSYDEFTKGKETSKTETTAGWADSLTNSALDVFMAGVNKKIDGNDIGRFAANNPNMSKSSKKLESIEGSMSFSLTFEYEMRYISGIDPTLAMLDLLGNAMRMGTNESEFRYNTSFLMESSEFANNLYKLKYNNTSAIASGLLNKELTSILGSTIEATGKFLDGLSSAVQGLFSTTEKQKTEKDSLLVKPLKHIFDRYREVLKASISVDTGLPNGSWHVMIGDPQNPFISCGDLVVNDKSIVSFSKELGMGGFPTSFSVTYTLTMNRPRGRQELMRIFNAGRGRVYTYKKADDNKDYGIYYTNKK